MNCKISISTIDFQKKYGDRGAIDVAARMGVCAIDYGSVLHSILNDGDVYTLGVDAVREYFSSLAEYAKERGVEIVQTHGRFRGYGNTSKGDAAYIKNAELDCVATAALGAKHTVFHTPSYDWEGDMREDRMLDVGVSMLTRVLPFAKENGVKIAAETYGASSKCNKVEFFGIPENLLELIKRVRETSPAADSLCVCVDTGHTNLAVRHGCPSASDVIRKLGSLVEVLHLHDNDGIKDQHKIVGTGIIDWNDVFSALDEIGYSGCYNLEPMLNHFGEDFEIEEATFSVKVLEHMLKTKN